MENHGQIHYNNDALFKQYMEEPTIQQYFQCLCREHHLTAECAMEYIYQQWQDRKLQRQQEEQLQESQMNVDSVKSSDIYAVGNQEQPTSNENVSIAYI